MQYRNLHGSVEVVKAAYEELPFSEFLHHPAATAARLDSVRAVRLRRRGADDLALTNANQLDRDGTVIDFTARLLASIDRTGARNAIKTALPEALPWAAFLPDPDLEEMLSEIIAVAQGSASLRNLAPLAILLDQWRHSAEVYADPELLALITSDPEGDLGPVAVPEANE